MIIYRLIWFFSLVFLFGIPNLAQEIPNDAIIFIWNDRVLAQSISGNYFINTEHFVSDELENLILDNRNVYTFEQSPLMEALADGYGFYQGIWSEDRTRFVFTAIAANSPQYRIIQVENGQQEILISSQVGIEHGYLVPLAWKITGELILLERYSLHNLQELRIWDYSPITKELVLQTVLTLPNLKGNSVTLPEGIVFIGFDTIGLLGYLFNINTGQVSTFQTSFVLQEPPSIFETYPIAVIGLADIMDLQLWSDSYADEPMANTSTPIAFLYWPLPDYARAITCYPDSEWLTLNHSVECPGLTVPREYDGHEGTDVGGRPAGLAINTPVYAAAEGLVIANNNTCQSGDLSCGDAYGNYVLLEHNLVRDNNIETWFTGYAHLQMILVDTHTYIAELGIPIALSGDTGLGGAHLHFEVRSPQDESARNWIDPWDNRSGTSLWIGGNDYPIAAVTAFPPPSQMICRTIDGNNIRTGPDTSYAVVEKTISTTEYEVFQVENVVVGQAIGEWYHIRWGNNGQTGWIWSDLLSDCISLVEEAIP